MSEGTRDAVFWLVVLLLGTLLYDRLNEPRPAPVPPSVYPPVIENQRPAPPAPTPEPESEPIPEACPDGCAVPPPGCDIKGNISYRTGERIYHVPGQQNYDDAKIAPDYGERWFCTEEAAVENGWRKAKR
ncbi:MAG TPA: hypothetical protein VL025_17560 [Thermoanaerobaculia bacterium]|nr:hypothetical protein [Thermoanaerobaculia bacterium]